MTMGRPAKFKSPEELQAKIDEYIKKCPDFITKYTSEGKPYKVYTPTVCGLAYFLGFESRQSMYDYEKRNNDFSYIIRRSRLWIEKNYEQNLVFAGATGSIFALKNMGWKDKQEIESNNTNHNLNADLNDTEKAEALERVKNKLSELEDYE